MRGKKVILVFCSRKKTNRFTFLFGKRTWIFRFTFMHKIGLF